MNFFEKLNYKKSLKKIFQKIIKELPTLSESITSIKNIDHLKVL
jgi:hypothetical protein